MQSRFAYSFTTSLDRTEMFLRLRERGPWRWVDRNSDRWGQYLSTSSPRGSNVQLLIGEPTPDRCTVNVEFESDAADAEEKEREIREALLERILPQLEARDVALIEAPA